MLAKWFKEQGLTQLQIRENIFLWGKTHSMYIKYNVNDIIKKALDDKQRLKDNVAVKINESDIQEIKHRFDNPKTRLVALAILCYAKTYANRDKEFNVSSIALGEWLRIDSSNIRRKYLKELIEFEYISVVDSLKNTYKWDGNSQQSYTYKINVPILNSGNYTLEDNKISVLYDSLFC